MKREDRPFYRSRLAHLLALGGLLAMLGALPVVADEPSAFERLLEQYEPVRLALVNDTLDDTGEFRKTLESEVETLSRDFSAAAAGVDTAQEANVEELLGELAVAAEALAKAADLSSARDAFYAFSKPLVRYRAALVASGHDEDELPVVAYCAMAKRSWLQPAGKIGNPYHGQSMAECGEVVGAAR